MNNRQRDAAAEAFRKIAAELDGAKENAEKRAKANADEMELLGEARRLFIERFVEGWCIDQLTRGAASIRATVEVYLTPARSPRGRR